MSEQEFPEFFNYHTQRTLKGLQDDFDRAKTVKQRVEVAKAIEGLLDSYRAMVYAREFAKIESWRSE